MYTLIKNYLKKISYKRLLHQETIIKNTKEGFDGFKDIIINMISNKYIKNYLNNFQKLTNIQRNESVISQFPRFFIELLTILIFSIAMFYLFLVLGYSFKEIAPILGLYALASLRIYPGVTRILSNIQALRTSIATEDRIINYLNEGSNLDLNQTKNVSVNPINIRLEKNIKIENLTYEINNKIIFKDLNLNFQKNEFIGICGESGSGKTTLLNLIIGFIKPTKGRILLDGIELNDLSFNSWMQKIGYVGQNIFLFNDTIENNIALSSQKVDLERVKDAATQAQLSNFFNNNVSFKSLLSEHASNISGGEKQRISIARAIYKKADVLFLDEPTSSLNKEISDKLIQVINSFYKKKTIFFVSHEINNLKKCDKVLKVNNHSIEQIS